MNLLDNWMLRLALKHEKEKGSCSVVKEAKEFAREIDFDLETEINEEMKNTENARKLKRIAKEKGKQAIGTAWKSKLLYGQHFLRSQKADIDLHNTHQRLRSARLKSETEGFIVAEQDQSPFTRNIQVNIFHNGADPRCRFCNIITKTIDNLISGSTILASNEYTNRHNGVGQHIHRKICNNYDIETPDKWYEHKLLPVVDTPKVTILWNFPIRTNRTIQANRPDIVIKHKQNKHVN